jgi:hypothetical protein
MSPSNPELRRCERTIQSGLATFIAVGTCLAEIRDKRYYLETHSSFEHYCSERWGMASRTAHQTIASARAALSLENVASASGINESTARVLATVDEQTRKETWLQAIAEMPDITADKLRSWIRKRGHIRQEIGKCEQFIACPNCGCDVPRYSLAAASRGSRIPSKAPPFAAAVIGARLLSSLDYGCGRLRNALELERVSYSVTYCDLPDQIRRVQAIAGGRKLVSVPTQEKAECVWLINVLHIQPSGEARQSVAAAAAAAARVWLVVETPADQPYYRSRGARTPYAFLSPDQIVSLFPAFVVVATKWTNSHNKTIVFRRAGARP